MVLPLAFADSSIAVIRNLYRPVILAPLLIVLLLSVSLFPATVFASQNNTGQCSEQDMALIASLENQLLDLAALEKKFQQLTSGEITADFTLASLFRVDLLDQQAVDNRIQALAEPQPQPIIHCSQQTIQPLIQQQQQALKNITAMRLKYLSLPLDERHYLISLVNIYQDLNSKLTLITANETQFKKDLAALEASIKVQETEAQQTVFNSLQSADNKKTLAENLNQSKEKLTLLKQVYEQDQATASSIKPLLALTKSLLIDYHRTYQPGSDSNKTSTNNRSGSEALFQQLTSPKDLNALIRLRFANNQQDDDYQTTLAALIILHGRIHTHARQQASLSQFTGSGFHRNWRLHKCVGNIHILAIVDGNSTYINIHLPQYCRLQSAVFIVSSRRFS
ncbi:MAG: hypothetical protein CSA49_00950, partial [Gammaproteobacteria bacterium]